MKKILSSLLILFLFSTNKSFTQTLQSDSLALVALYNSTDGANWTNNTNWLTGSVDTWNGVEVILGRVTSLQLCSNNLVGNIPSEIGNLTELVYLTLCDNQLNNNIPLEIGNLTNLYDLTLSGNQLSGSIPQQIGNLSNLNYLTFEMNQLTGNIPPEIGNMVNLVSLNLSLNQLSGSIPIEIGNLTRLTHLYLARNQLTDNVPVEIGNLTMLNNLTLYHNQLTGSIPTEISNLTSLEHLYISNNLLTELPDLSSLSSLNYCQVQNNLFDYADLERANWIATANVDYAPQNTVPEIIRLDAGNITLSTNITGTANVYQWQESAVDIEGETNSTLVLPIDTSGIFGLTLTNSAFPDLTFSFSPLEIVGPYTLQDDDVVVVDGVIESCSYDFSNTDIIIPETLDGQKVSGIKSQSYYLNGVFRGKGITSLELPLTIKNIGDFAFDGNAITSLTLPDSITTIGAYAFRYNAIETVILPDSVSLIDKQAFLGNPLLNIDLPFKLRIIGDRAFEGNHITNLIIPSNVEAIGSSAFYSTFLTNITFADNSNIRSIGSSAFAQNFDLPTTHNNASLVALLGTDGNTYPLGTTITDVNIMYYDDTPYTLTDEDVVVVDGVIQKANFSAKNIIIPDNLDGQMVVGIANGKAYYDGVFAQKELVAVQLPTTMVNIGLCAFQDNSLLTSIEIPEGVVRIGAQSFSGCNLTSVVIPSSVTAIDGGAFNGNAITQVNSLPHNGLFYADGIYGIETTTISFGGLNKVMNYIPSTVTTIGDLTFLGADLESIIIPSSVTSINYWAFYYSGITSITIPSNVTTIEYNAFRYNPDLTSVIFESNSSILSIENRAFIECSNLSSITLPDHANSSFVEYQDGNAQVFNPGEAITDFTTSYSAKIVFTVTFLDSDGATMLKSEDVEYGNSAIAPADPIKTGYTFTGWDIDFTNVTEDLIVIAQYEENTATGVENNYLSNINIYPNPVSDKLIIEISENVSITKIEICNIIGKVVFSEAIKNESNLEIDFSDYPQGFHLIRVTNTKGGVYTKKLLKK